MKCQNETCTNEFEPVGKQIFCSRACKHQHYRRQKKVSEVVPIAIAEPSPEKGIPIELLVRMIDQRLARVETDLKRLIDKIDNMPTEPGQTGIDDLYASVSRHQKPQKTFEQYMIDKENCYDEKEWLVIKADILQNPKITANQRERLFGPAQSNHPI